MEQLIKYIKRIMSQKIWGEIKMTFASGKLKNICYSENSKVDVSFLKHKDEEDIKRIEQ
jgi:hypothetical protein